MAFGPSIQELLEAIPDGAALVGADGRFASANAAMGELFGMNVVGRTVLEVTRNLAVSEAATSALSGSARQLELTLPATRRTLWVHLTPLRGGALLGAHDSTKAKRMEAARRDFVANASHELRTPVSAIAAAAETLLTGTVTDAEQSRTFIEMISRHAERLSRLTQELLDLSRIESGDWRLETHPVDVHRMAQALLDLFRPKAEAKQMVLTSKIPGEAFALADRRALEQILVNLVDNAIKHTPSGGRVTLQSEQAGKAIVISVVDTGPGIERHHLSRLFERFYRIDPGRAREAGGAGLGLAIAKHLAEAQGGEVGVESGPSGTRFWIRLRATH